METASLSETQQLPAQEQEPFPSSLESIRRELERVAPYFKDRDDEIEYRCAVIIMAAAKVGNDVDRLSAFTSYPKRLIQTIYDRMQAAVLWVEDQVRCEHWLSEEGKNAFDLEFWMDVLIAHGSWTRLPMGLGHYEYRQIGPEPEDLLIIQ